MKTISPLSLWPRPMKYLVSVFMLVLTIGVTTGLVYVSQTTGFRPGGAEEHYRGSPANDDFDIQEKYEKSFENMLLTTHSHIISFSIVFFILGILLYFTSTFSEGWKRFFMIEPLVSTFVTFGSLWALRYLHSSLSILTLISSLLMYVSFYIMAGVIFYESMFSPKEN
ncbi:MAG: hypothetical protein V3S48_07330 [Candidatus Neomarinimicrobiota bacterium]